MVARVVERLSRDEKAYICGPVCQELLTGITPPTRFQEMRAALRKLPFINTLPEDFEQAAALATVCKTNGVAGSPTDFLILAMARREKAEVFTFDRDFDHYARFVMFRRFVSAPTLE